MSDPLNEIERAFLAFGDKTRLRLLALMQHGEVSVNYLCETLQISQPKVSRHLAYLRTMGMVRTRRDGKWIYYSLLPQYDEPWNTLIRDTLRWIGSIEGSIGTAPAYRSPFVSGNDEGMTPVKALDISSDADTIQKRGELEVYLL